MQHDRERPLTFWQKGRLLFECLPFVFMLAATIFTLTVWQALTQRLTGERYPPLLAPFLGLVTLYTAWIAFQRLRDVVAGSAVIAEDRVLRFWRARGRGTGRCYGKFEQLGTLRMWPRDFVRAATEFDLSRLADLDRSVLPGTSRSSDRARYRVTYSPASKIAWSVEQIKD